MKIISSTKSCTDVKKDAAEPKDVVISTKRGGCPYRKSACNLIQKAIDQLGEVAMDDEVAKESIANLGVVLLDLKS